MGTRSNATLAGRETQTGGLVLGALGVLAFSVSLPATRIAVDGGLDPWVVAFGRAVVAAALAAVVLTTVLAARPTRAQARSLVVVAGGVVVGFPLATSVALETESATHGIVITGILPALTACFAVVRAGERPGPAFWAASVTGVGVVVAFALHQSGGGLTGADAILVVGNVACAAGYAEGAVLARRLGGARTICWALVLALPLTVPVTAVAVALGGAVGATSGAWAAFGYVSVFSMFLGFFAWYAGLARGGVARVGQVQLAQALLSLVWAALLVGEAVPPSTIGAAVLVLACVAVTQRARVGTAGPAGVAARPPVGMAPTAVP